MSTKQEYKEEQTGIDNTETLLPLIPIHFYPSIKDVPAFASEGPERSWGAVSSKQMKINHLSP